MGRQKGSRTGRCQGCNHLERVRIERLLAAGATKDQLEEIVADESLALIDHYRIVRGSLYKRFSVASEVGDSNSLALLAESDRLVVLAGLVIQECRQRGIVVPSPRSLERFCVDLRHQARREIERRLTGGLSAEQRRRLDALTERRAKGGQSWLVWLRQIPEATKPAAMLGLIERLNHVRAIGIDPARGHRVHQ